MNATRLFPEQPILVQNICPNTRKSLSFISLPSTRTIKHVEFKKTSIKRRDNNNNTTLRHHRSPQIVSLMSSSSINPSSLSPSDTIKQFYGYINEKNSSELLKLISNDCFYEDLSFPKPLQGKKEVFGFLVKLMTCMGENVEFGIEHVCEGDDELMAGLNWHLEWKKKKIPFTRGWSFYQFSVSGDRLIIKKAQIIAESPVKPGGMVLTLLQIVTMLFDAFPKTTEWFLESHQEILEKMVKVYNVALGPFISPILAFYINTWNLISGLFRNIYKLLLFISKFFNM